MYTVKDFDNLPWNPLKEKKDIESKWKFKSYAEFNIPMDKKFNKDLFYNLMCLVYHRESQLVTDIDNVSIRYQKALELLNIAPKEDGKFEKNIQDILDYKNVLALKMIYRFCSVIGDFKYKTYIALSIAYDKELMSLIDGSDVEKFDKVNKAINDTIVNLEKLKKEIFSKDDRVADQSNEEILSYARTPGYPELVAHGKIKIEKK